MGVFDSIGDFVSGATETIGSLSDSVSQTAGALASVGVDFGDGSSGQSAAGPGGFQGTFPGVGNSFTGYAPPMLPASADPGAAQSANMLWPIAALGVAFLVLRK